MLTFDDETHTYRNDGIIIPSVTQIIEPMYDFRFVKQEDLDRAKVLGSAVDKTIRLSETGRLDEDNTNPLLLRYLSQWRMFRKETSFNPTAFGTPLFCDEYKYAGTPDVYGKIGVEQYDILIDIKTGQYYSAHQLQTAGYLEAMIRLEMLQRRTARASLYLSETGYTLKFHNDLNDRSVFLGLVTQYYWRQKHGK